MISSLESEHTPSYAELRRLQRLAAAVLSQGGSVVDLYGRETRAPEPSVTALSQGGNFAESRSPLLVHATPNSMFQDASALASPTPTPRQRGASTEREQRSFVPEVEWTDALEEMLAESALPPPAPLRLSPLASPRPAQYGVLGFVGALSSRSPTLVLHRDALDVVALHTSAVAARLEPQPFSLRAHGSFSPLSSTVTGSSAELSPPPQRSQAHGSPRHELLRAYLSPRQSVSPVREPLRSYLSPRQAASSPLREPLRAFLSHAGRASPLLESPPVSSIDAAWMVQPERRDVSRD
jgi:hypothetical protein